MNCHELQGLQTARAASVRDPLVQCTVHATPRTLAEGRREGGANFVRVYYIASSSFHCRRRRRRLIAHISQCIFTLLRKPSEIEIEG